MFSQWNFIPETNNQEWVPCIRWPALPSTGGSSYQTRWAKGNNQPKIDWKLSQPKEKHPKFEKGPKKWWKIIFYLSDEISQNHKKFKIFGIKTKFNLREVGLIVENVCKCWTLYDNIRWKSNCWLHSTSQSYFVPPLNQF